MQQKQFRELQKLIRTIQNENERQIAQEYLDTIHTIKLDLSDMFEQFGEDGVVRRDVMEKYGRMRKLENLLAEHVSKLTNNQIKYTKKAITEVFKQSYYYRGYVIETLAGFRVFNMLNQKFIDEVTYNDMDLIKWDTRVKENNKMLIRQLKESITSGLIQGYSYEKIAKEVTERMDIGKKKAVKIVQTETHRSNQQANLKSMQDAVSKGVIMKKRWLSSLDQKTRDTHRNLDGQIVEVDEYFESKGKRALAPGKFGRAEEDINCRCDMISVFDGIEPSVRRARNPHTGKNELIKHQTYNEWFGNINK
jgi:SPP1 gp7 family putative phage head morphogenesis protein